MKRERKVSRQKRRERQRNEEPQNEGGRLVENTHFDMIRTCWFMTFTEMAIINAVLDLS